MNSLCKKFAAKKQGLAAHLCGHSQGGHENPLHAKGGEEGVQVAREPEGNGLVALQAAGGVVGRVEVHLVQLAARLGEQQLVGGPAPHEEQVRQQACRRRGNAWAA